MDAAILKEKKVKEKKTEREMGGNANWDV